MAKVIVYQLEGGAAIVEVDTNEHYAYGALFSIGFFVNENYTAPTNTGNAASMYFYAC